MRVTDAHMHLWGDPRAGYPFEPLYNLESLERDMSLAEVDRAVLIPVHSGFDSLLEASEYCIDVAEAQPERFAVMPLMEEELPEAPAALADMLKRPGMKGLRFNLARNRPERMEWIWPVMVSAGLPVSILAARGDLSMVAPILEANPDLTVLLCNAAAPSLGPDPFIHLDQLLNLAKYRNLVVKISGLTKFSKESFPYTDLHEFIHRIYDTFGAERLAWGSNYSAHPNRPPYREVVDLFRVVCDFFSPSDLEWIMDRTVSRVLNWDD